MLNNTFKSETMWFSYALVILGVVELNLKLMENIIPPEYYGAVVTVIGVIVALLRFRTTKPLKDL